MNIKQYAIFIAASALLFVANLNPSFAQQALKTGNISLHFKNVVAGKDLKLNDTSSLYKNANGDDFKISIFKYYISNINLVKTDGEALAIPDTYYLINAADSSSLKQQISGIPEGNYKSINFTIGVDSARNFAGAQTAALDPAKGMFWSWNSGYIFVKLEGESPQSTAKKNRLIFHIGGVKSPNNTIRTFNQHFPKTLKVVQGKLPLIELIADAGTLFQGKTTVAFSKFNFTMGGPNSVLIADNYADGLFKVVKIKN